MNLLVLLLAVAIAIGFTSPVLADKYDDLAAKGYRWVNADGPYGCPSLKDLHQIVEAGPKERSWNSWNNCEPTVLPLEQLFRYWSRMGALSSNARSDRNNDCGSWYKEGLISHILVLLTSSNIRESSN